MQSIHHTGIISEELGGSRLDSALARLFNQYSRSQIKSWIESGYVQINGTQPRPRNIVFPGDKITLSAPVITHGAIEPQDIPFTVLYEDNDLIVVDKPAGCVVHPGAGNIDQTLANGLLHRYSELSPLPRAGLIHRLDKETSGLLIVARHPLSYQKLVQLMAQREISRQYLALCNGIIVAGGTIDQPIGRDANNRLKMTIRRDGRKAITHYRVAERFRAHTLLDINLETGRTHQIRVHLSHLGNPVVGDSRYGGRTRLPKQALEDFSNALSALDRHALHAKTIAFEHPFIDKEVHVESPIPDTIQKLLALAKSDVQHARRT